MEEQNKKKQITLAILGGLFLLILVIGAAYSYFQVVANNNATTTTITGNSELVGQAILTTNISSIKLNVTNSMMTSSSVGTKYYATEDGTPVTTATEGSGLYTLATASLSESNVPVFCSYTYDITATTSKTISDGSDVDYKLVIIESNGTETTYTLSELLSGVTHTGRINSLTYGTNQTLKIKAYITNTESNQNDLSENTIAITITPKSGDAGFSCNTANTFAEKLVASGELWQSGLEGDGYRYVGSGDYDSDTSPSNFICFGTADKTECENNKAKYMYRIIGVFEGSDGKQHLKLISFKQLSSTYAWNANYAGNISWENSSLSKGLNGSYFLTNTTYDYLQSDEWLSKIENWTWSAVNTKTYQSGGPDYYDSLTPREIYLHEMNRSSKNSSIGAWSAPTAKIGLMYASDFTLSQGSSALSVTGGTYTNRAVLVTGWMNQSYTGSGVYSARVWTLSSYGIRSGFYAWSVDYAGYVVFNKITDTCGVRPVFYLTSDVKISSGSGEYSNPYILSE